MSLPTKQFGQNLYLLPQIVVKEIQKSIIFALINYFPIFTLSFLINKLF